MKTGALGSQIGYAVGNRGLGLYLADIRGRVKISVMSRLILIVLVLVLVLVLAFAPHCDVN